MSHGPAQRREPFHRHMLEALPIPVVILDQDQRIVFANQVFYNVFGLLEGGLVGKLMWDCWDPLQFAYLKEAYEDVLANKGTRVVDHRSVELGHDFELWISWADGHVIVACVDVTIYVRHGRQMEAEFNAIKSIVDELNVVNSEAVDTANTDLLTGLCTRRRAVEIASRVFPALAERNLPVSLILLDIDHFKYFNDTFGHAEGDKVLRLVGAVMSEFKNDLETVCRFGGEEFLMICPRIGVRKAVLRATQLLDAIRTISQVPAPVTTSMGVAGRGRKETDWTLTLARADKALYLAKTRGRNRVVPWTSVNDGASAFSSAA